MAAANLCEVLLPTIRGIGLARLLPPEQFGIAITVTVTASILELISDLGVGQLAVKFGNGFRLNTLHSVSAIRGCILGLLIAGLGPVFALVFNTQGATWVYMFVGLSSVLRGLTHLELKANTREHNYRGEAMSSLCGQLVWTPVTLISAAIWHDYRAMAFGLVASVASTVILSHWIAIRPWRMGWHRDTVKEAMSYGGPLALNGMAFAVTSLGDRTITGAKIGMVQLAHYSALTTSAFLPRSAILKYLNSIFLSQFVNATHSDQRRTVGYIWLIVISTLSASFAVLYYAFGQIATEMVFGKSYRISQTVVSMVALLGCIRYMAGFPTPPSLALGHTGILVKSTLASTSGLGLGLVFLMLQSKLDFLLLGLSLGEAAALLWVTLQVSRFLEMDRKVAWIGVAGPIVITAGLTASTYLFELESAPIRIVFASSAAILQAFVVAIVISAAKVRFVEVFAHAFPRRNTSVSIPT